MTKKRVLMLGGGFMQGVAIRAAHALGCIVAAADGNPSAVCAAEADEFVCIDLKDTERLIEYARYLQQHGGLDAVFTAATDFSAAVAAIAAACGLRGHRLDAALNATDKTRMRECFRTAGVPSPAFVELTAGGSSHQPSKAVQDSLRGLLGGLAGRFPLVVKPVDNMGARGCSLARDAASLQDAVAAASRYSRSGRVIVEEYIEGSEFSIEGLIFDGQLHITALADRHIFFPPYFIEMGHTIPSERAQELADEVMSVFERGVHALGLTDGAVKGDILVRDGKAFVGEIAARLSGGYMSGWTVPYSSGLDITAAALTLALGGTPRLHTCGKDTFIVPLKQNCQFVSAERAWISIPGQVAAVSGLEAARAAPFVKDVFPRAGVGDTVVFPRNNVEKCGNVLSAAPTRAEAVHASEAACRAIVLRLKPHVAETDAFLADCASPWDNREFPPNFLQCKTWDFSGADKAGSPESEAAVPGVPNSSFDQLLSSAAYSEKDGFVLPDFAAAALDSAHDLQGRVLRELLRQALELEPRLAAVLCTPVAAGADNSGSADCAARGSSASAEVVSAYVNAADGLHHTAGQSQAALQRRSAYWKALIRGGLQGLLYRYDCEHS